MSRATSFSAHALTLLQLSLPKQSFPNILKEKEQAALVQKQLVHVLSGVGISAKWVDHANTCGSGYLNNTGSIKLLMMCRYFKCRRLIICHRPSYLFMIDLTPNLSSTIRVLFGRIFENDSISQTKLIEHSINQSNSVVIQLHAELIFPYLIHYFIRYSR